MFRVTAMEEDYLKTIYTLDLMGAGIRVEDMAEALSVSRRGASRVLDRLEKAGLVEQFGKNRVCLTDAGRRQARGIKSRYEIVRLYFVEILHVDFKTAAQEAGKLEHSLSDVSLAAMKYAVEHNDDWDELAQLISA